jgi:8-amino-7-oxononanoate synthase
MMVDGQRLLAFCSNDYLGLAADPRIAEALCEGAQRYGAGSGASHLISGHSKAHALLESALAEFLAPQLVNGRVLYLSSGYVANLAVITALADKQSEIFSEALNHASLIDGTRLSRAKVSVYPHRDLQALAALLAGSTAARKLVVTDSVFSMDGDLAPLPELLALCEQHDAWLIVDDAHGFGVLGEHGRGALEHFAIRSPQLVVIGTLSKAAGVAGAFVAAHETVIEWLVQRARSYIYSTASPPSLAHALLTSVKIIATEEGRQRRGALNQRIKQWQAGLSLQCWQRLVSDNAIQPVVIGDNATTMLVGQALRARGFWVGSVRPPTVPAGTSRLRVTLSAAHTESQVAQLIAALTAVEGEFA